ncbi:MAG: hypothetical protein IPN29_00010 [Saprospiraceae bacterium]|nr:hypothetical protein [Saprospiraceae bacterium]
MLRNNASISDKDGNLLLFTNGCSVSNKNHEVMPNGDSLNAGTWFDKYWKSCAAGYPGAQDVMLLPDPGNDKGYTLFHGHIFIIH